MQKRDQLDQCEQDCGLALDGYGIQTRIRSLQGKIPMFSPREVPVENMELAHASLPEPSVVTRNNFFQPVSVQPAPVLLHNSSSAVSQVPSEDTVIKKKMEAFLQLRDLMDLNDPEVNSQTVDRAMELLDEAMVIGDLESVLQLINLTNKN